ncbi:hypothetical protein UB33_05875 [Photobacterium angustum]|uniref:capsule biosynthesis GfcC family protein n=1 Tax=Photobacterium angustum TaxID=661 RepID=UPI0005E046A8|nr:capsule biosynthesis GfcC family protein [Photobacterium angustum]KJG07206.1 hypothetical protein UB33_05875 [Photobacterium angustum]PSV90430.1 hypothetical protein CTN01_16015 [Photobacterium angustum]
MYLPNLRYKVCRFIAFIFLALNVTCTYANTTVLIPPTTELKYSEPVRLAQAVEDAIKSHQIPNSPIYWLGSSLLDISTPVNKSAVIDKLNILAQSENSEPFLSKSFSNNAEWIEKNITFKKVITPLDFDTIRISQPDNPLLDGKYQIILSQRTNDILIFGAIEKPLSVKWKARTSASQYLVNANVLSSADKSYVTVIQPDGHVEKHPIAYWNSNHHDIAPGATIFIGYQTLFSNYSDLNNDIISMLINRTLR